MFKKFLNSKKEFPVLAAIAAGLYPLLFFYSRNFTMIDSWQHFGYFLILFLLLPIITFIVLNWVTTKIAFRWQNYLLPFLNLFLFLFFLKTILFAGPQKKISVIIFLLSAILTFFFHTQFKKWMLFQFILALIGLLSLIPVITKHLNYSDEWQQLPDYIENVIFEKTPNVYYIQPDGYINFSELSRGYYNFDNAEFETYLAQHNFKSYPSFRSNYDATLASNSAIFTMKHHLYYGSEGNGEVARARNIIMGDNPVLRIFKNNGYQTYFFAEYPYLLMNRPKMGFDYSNFNYSEIPFLGTGLETKKEILPSLKKVLAEKDASTPKFFFIEIFNPKHIDGSSNGENLMERKRTEYLENLQQANATLKEMVASILKNDPNALIVIMADHGGYVGMERLQEGNEKTIDPDKIKSIFSSVLAIHWPKDEAPKFDGKLKTSVNVFRILFSTLSEDTTYLKHLENDSSYGLILKGAPKGIYELIDENGKPVFNEVRLFN